MWNNERRTQRSLSAIAKWKDAAYRKKQLSNLCLLRLKAAEKKKALAREKPLGKNNKHVTHSRLVETYGHVCFVCKLEPVWNSQPLVMVIHHFSGETLRLLCPNCHSQKHQKRTPAIKK